MWNKHRRLLHHEGTFIEGGTGGVLQSVGAAVGGEYVLYERDSRHSRESLFFDRKVSNYMIQKMRKIAIGVFDIFFTKCYKVKKFLYFCSENYAHGYACPIAFHFTLTLDNGHAQP